MITTSAWWSPDSDGSGMAGSAVCAHSDGAGASAVAQVCSGRTSMLRGRPDGCVRKGLHRREMKIGLGEIRHFRRSAKSRLTLAALDPADLVAEFSCDPDIVVLALGHMQDVGLLVAERRLPPFIVGEKFRIRFGDAGLVGADGVVERIAKRVRVSRQRDAIGVG